MAKSYIKEIGDRLSKGQDATVGEHVKTIAPEVYMKSDGTVVEIQGAIETSAKTIRLTDKSSDTGSYPLVVAAASSPTSGTAYEGYYDTGVKLTPSTNTISANISGNAATATKPKTTTLTTSNNLDDIKGSSLGDVLYYCWASGNAPTGATLIDGSGTAPTSTMEVIRTHSGNYCIQTVYTASKGVYQRIYNNGSWGDWYAYSKTTHTHGNITSGGALQTNDITIANGDKLVVTDSSDSSKVARASISFDGSTTTKALTQKGTWETFNNYSHPAGSAASKTGVPTADATPGFGGTFKVNQITTDSTSHVSAVTERTITIPNATATTSADGLMSSTDKTKLNGIATGAEVNVQSDWDVTDNTSDAFIKNKPYRSKYVDSTGKKYKVCSVTKLSGGSTWGSGLEVTYRRGADIVYGHLIYKYNFALYLEKSGDVSVNSNTCRFYYIVNSTDSSIIDIYVNSGSYCTLKVAPLLNGPKSDVNLTDFGTVVDDIPEGATEITPVWVANTSASSGTAPVKVDAYGTLTAVPMDTTPTANSTNLMTSGAIKNALDGITTDVYPWYRTGGGTGTEQLYKVCDITISNTNSYIGLCFKFEYLMQFNSTQTYSMGGTFELHVRLSNTSEPLYVMYLTPDAGPQISDLVPKIKLYKKWANNRLDAVIAVYAGNAKYTGISTRIDGCINQNGSNIDDKVVMSTMTLYTPESDYTEVENVVNKVITARHDGTAKGSASNPVYVTAEGAITECTTYAGGTAVTLNNASKAGSTASFYAPTAGGTANYVLIGNGTTSAPTWAEKAPKAVVADYLNMLHTNEVNFKNVPTSGNKERIWFNYRNGDTDAADSTNLITDYYFGNRNNAVTGVRVRAETFIGNVTGNVSGSSGSCTGNAATASAAQSGSALETAINGKVSKSGDTMTGLLTITRADNAISISHGTANKYAGIQIQRTDTSTQMSVGISSSDGTTHGIYSNKHGKWIVCASANGVVTLNGSNSTSNIRLGNTDVGSSAQPVYIDDGQIKACTMSSLSVGSATTATNANNAKVTTKTDDQIYLTGVLASGYSSGGNAAVYTDTGIYATATSGQLQATSYKVTANATMQYNSTDAAVEFVFN